HVGGEAYSEAHLKRGSERMRWVQINGVTSNILDMRDQDVELGRFISDQDDYSRRKAAFLGHEVAERLFPGEDPIGQRLRLHGEEFTVVGVAKEIGEILGGNFDEFVSIPMSTHQKLFQQRGNPIAVVVKARSRELVESAMDQTRIVLRSARRVPYEADDDFAIITPDAIRSFIDDFTKAFRIIMIALPALSIVIGGIVIMNIMMISVTERTREIGIRKSIGARQRNIMTQFLLESIVLSIGGGMIGIIGGIKLGSMVLALMEVHATPTALAVILGFGISTSVGLFFGIYPAMKAARLDPIKALSYE
ncbi:MAG TPA: ABC transporter permease, partial [Planctomycetaceae bacterium]|nr:ABC transporter permease [Planctomycetaceae bacterium]